jgi:dihydrofolate synthase / folylpolyglutamate synthase
MYQRIGANAFKKDLTNTIEFAAHLGDPHKKFRSIHVGGTNGKGSTSHMLASILQEAGLKVGLYTSPHLKDFRERIRINGQEIPEESVVEFIEENEGFLASHRLSFFEMTVGMAFDHFAKNEVDIAVIEVGLGGRLDSTNIITPVLSVITNIGLDHVQMLGDTLAQIAVEKAGIIKEGVPVVIGERSEETSPVFIATAGLNNAEIFFAEEEFIGNYESDLKGDYQKKNIQTTITAIGKLDENWGIGEQHIRQGLQKVKENTGLRGRWDVIGEKPKVVCDTAHNAEGLQWVMKQLQKEIYEQLFIVLGVVNDKDLDKILPLFPLHANYIFTKPDVPRGMDAEILKEKAEKFGLKGEVFSSVSQAYEAAMQQAGKDDLIYVGGSTFTVAEII